ncbi:hypothetical protein BSL78_09300 [Apostichopus japonicus]|uniref:Uncharacterized protein n=1 Tax=Stichopus japonicus TaxID=307972 RepID=A0A2G8L0K9_STIJA|nr:hypothetical protein BSL78_09300 [Apostichopus japonicus]
MASTLSQTWGNSRTGTASAVNKPISHRPVEERITYEPPTDPEAARHMEAVVSYLKDTLVLDKMTAFTQSLTKSSKLPYNPYPVFSKQFMPLLESGKSSERYRKLWIRFVRRTRKDFIAPGVSHGKNVKVCSAHFTEDDSRAQLKFACGKFDWFHIMKDSEVSVKSKLQNPLQSTTSELIYGIKGHTNVWGLKSMVQVIDPDCVRNIQKVTENCIPSNIDTAAHELYTGQILTSIISPLTMLGSFYPRPGDVQIRLDYLIYGKDVDAALDIFANNLLSDIEHDMSEDSDCKLLYVSFTKVQNQGNEVIVRKWIKDKIISQKNEFKTEIVTSTKQVNSIKAEDVLLRQNPYQTIAEGIFLKKADVEAYVLSMRRHPASPMKAVPGKLSRRTSSRPGSEMMSASTGGSRQNSDSLDETIKKPLRQWYQQMLRGLSEVPDCFRILSLLLILILLDRKKYTLETITNIYRFLQSTSSKFHFASCQNHVIVEFIQTFGVGQKSRRMLVALVQQYRKDILRTLDPSLQERPSHHVAFHSYFVYFFDDLEAILRNEDGPPLVAKQMIRKFLEFELFCDTVQYQLTEDALKNLDHLNIKSFISSCEEQLTPKSEAVQKVKDSSSSKGSDLSVEEAVKNTNHPVVMAKEGILMQYLIDIRLDEVWGNYLTELIITAGSLPQNPYPRLVSAMRRAAFKMRLMGNSDERLRKHLLSVEPQVAVARLNLYVLPECGVYGLKSALVTTNQDTVKKVLQVADAVSNDEIGSQRGKFEISSGISLTGRTVFYGKTVPYVLNLELHHHFYIKGPLGTGSEALQLFAKLVSDDIRNLKEGSGKVVMVTLYANGKAAAASVDELDQVKLSTVVLDTASRKQSLYLKMYYPTGWRYIQISKHYRLHFLFVDNADDRHEAYFPENPAEDHKYLFMSREEAVEYFQKCSQLTKISMTEKKRQLIEEQRKLIQEQKLLPAYETSLVHCLMNESTDLADIWRVLNSPAAQVEYIMSLAAALRDLFALCLKFDQSEQMQPASSQVKKRNQVQPITAEMKGNIELQTLYRMGLAFYEKVVETLSEPMVFAPSYLHEAIEKKMKDILDFQSSRIRLNQKTIIEMEETHHLLHPLLVATSSEADLITERPLQNIIGSS